MIIKDPKRISFIKFLIKIFSSSDIMLSDLLLLKSLSMKGGQWAPLETASPPVIGKDGHMNRIYVNSEERRE